MNRAPGDDDEVAKMSETYAECELTLRCSLEEPFFHFSSLKLETRLPACCVRTGKTRKSQL